MKHRNVLEAFLLMIFGCMLACLIWSDSYRYAAQCEAKGNIALLRLVEQPSQSISNHP